MAKGGASGGLKTAPKSTGGAGADNAMSLTDYVGYRALQIASERGALGKKQQDLMSNAEVPSSARGYDPSLGGTKQLTESNSLIASSPNNQITKPYDRRSRRALGYGAMGA